MNDFNSLLGLAESGGSYGAVNSLGYVGKYQFGDDRLDDFRRATGIDFTKEEFISNPELQERVQQWAIQDIDRQIDRLGLDKYFGQEIGGAVIDRNALRAVAHLGGIGGMRKFVETGGEYNPADAYGTRLSDYAARFGGDAVDERAVPQVNALVRMIPRYTARIDPEPFMIGGT